jgi:hypothetical protein
MFEISAKAYCDDHAGDGLKYVDKKGNDRKLAEVLNDVIQHLTKGGNDAAMKRRLTGATSELGKINSILSVTSMNQLVHNPRFIVSPADISRVFVNIFSLLEEMNA